MGTAAFNSSFVVSSQSVSWPPELTPSIPSPLAIDPKMRAPPRHRVENILPFIPILIGEDGVKRIFVRSRGADITFRVPSASIHKPILK